MTASLPSDSGSALAPLGFIEPHALLLTQPAPDQRLFKIMKAEHFIQSIEGGYLHFNRVDAYSDFPLADAHDGAELPLDQPANQAASFEKAPDFTLSDYYARSRGRTYACCFSLKNSPYMWEHYGLDSAMGQVGLEFDLEKLRRRLNGALSSEAALMCGDIRCRQIFSINYGEVAYVDRATHRGNLDRAANPLQYAYLKDRSYGEERELRVSLSALGMGRFVLADGREIQFPPSLQLGFDFREAFTDGTIAQVLMAPTTNEAGLVEALGRLGIGRAP